MAFIPVKGPIDSNFAVLAAAGTNPLAAVAAALGQAGIVRAFYASGGRIDWQSIRNALEGVGLHMLEEANGVGYVVAADGKIPARVLQWASSANLRDIVFELGEGYSRLYPYTHQIGVACRQLGLEIPKAPY